MAYKIWNECKESVPTIYLHSFEGDGKEIWDAAHLLNCPPFNLVVFYDLDTNAYLTPWPAAEVFKNQPPFSGKASEYLDFLLKEMLPEIEDQLPSPSSYRALVGYSLAGLFALWSSTVTATFSKVACVSASLWYPHFAEYFQKRPMMKDVRAIYFSLGDKESHTHHPLMKQVDVLTQAIYEQVKTAQVTTCFEINAGNHFTQPAERTAKAIKWILELENI